jgi:hypothetical protein
MPDDAQATWTREQLDRMDRRFIERVERAIAIGHVRTDLIARYNKDDAWSGRRDAFTRVSDHVATLIGAREGAAVIPLRG